MMSFDDFPVTPNRTVDSKRYYQSYLQARDVIQSAQAGYRRTLPNGTLMDLAHQLYAEKADINALFRARRDASDVGSLIWLSRIRSIAEWSIASGLVTDFRGLDREIIGEVVHSSLSVDGMKGLDGLLARNGIVLVHELAMPGTKVDGCCFRLESGHAVIGLSLRFARLDNYYFTLAHELAHVFLHSEHLASPIIDDLEEPDDGNVLEIQANRLARDALIPRHEWRTCPARTSLDEKDVRNFAEKIGVAPQIVAGRLRWELRRHDLFADLVHETDVREILTNA
jgi:HTH-type transcriptional regulator/antitoxin HigA